MYAFASVHMYVCVIKKKALDVSEFLTARGVSKFVDANAPIPHESPPLRMTAAITGSKIKGGT